MSDDKEQEYLHGNQYVTIFAEIKGQDDWLVVETEDSVLDVARKSDLVKKEDSYKFKRAQEQADELRLITQKAQENFDKLVDKLVDKSIIALASRIKFNVAFGDGGAHSAYSIILSTELEKMIKEKAPELVKDKKLFDL